MSGRSGALVAALLYLALALFAYRSTVGAPLTRLPIPERHLEAERPRFRLVYEADQEFVTGNIARVARAFATDPTRLGETGFCAPMRHPHTLGEHMLGEGLLGAIPWLLTRDPIFTFNAVVVLSTWISALAMYALAYYWTRNVAAALVAGLLFAFHPYRLSNPGHLFGFGNAWTALALLATHRLFAHGRWRDAALVALFLSLQLLESFYQVLALAIVGSVYAAALAAKHARRLPALAPKVIAVAIASGAVAWIVLGPYLDTQAVWGVLQGRKRLLIAPAAYLPGGAASPGWIALVLGAIGLADRTRGPRLRDGDDPRLALTAAGFLLFWCSLRYLTLPGIGRLPSPLVWAAWIPGLGAVRVLAALQFGVWLLVALFAAYGVVALLERLPGRARVAAALVLAGAVVLETFHPSLSRRSFGTIAGLRAYDARPAAPVLAQLARLPPGAVLDLPLDFTPRQKVRLMPGYLLQAGYHDRPVAACYNSFLSDLQIEVQQLADGLPDPRAAEALAALGFESVRVHHREAGANEKRFALPASDPTRAELVDRTQEVSLYRLVPPPVTEDFAAIAREEPRGGRIAVDPSARAIPFRFAGPKASAFRHPDPIEPQAVLLRWRAPDGSVVTETGGRLLLPPALASGQRSDRSVETVVSVPPGAYRVELVRAAAPELVLASREVSVRASTAGGATGDSRRRGRSGGRPARAASPE